jgi:hypothetical protein
MLTEYTPESEESESVAAAVLEVELLDVSYDSTMTVQTLSTVRMASFMNWSSTWRLD